MPQKQGQSVDPELAAGQQEAQTPFRVLVTAGGARVEFSSRVLDAIRFESSRAMNGVGGLGIGGVLLGTRAGNAFRVFAWRPLICDHSRGPAFLLSQRDLARMASYLEGVRLQGAAKRWDLLGWFVSHPKGGLTLSDEEQELQRRYFSPDGVILIVNPDQVGDAECAVRTAAEEESGEPVLVQPLPLRKRDPNEKRAKAQPDHWAAPMFEDDAPAPRKIPGGKWVWICGAALGLVAAGGGVWWSMREKPARSMPVVSAAPIEILSLHAGPRGGRFVIEWNGQAQAIRYASKVSLRIQDGAESSSMDLSPRDAAAGLQFYPIKSGHLRVSLILTSSTGQSFEESAEYYAGGQPAQAVSDLEGSVIAPAVPAPAAASSPTPAASRAPARASDPPAKATKKRLKKTKTRSAEVSSSTV